MADTITAATAALETQRRLLVDEYVRRAWNMWQSLTPQDWWNDAVTQGAAAYITQQQMAFVRAMRRLGISYADIMLRLVGTTPQGQIPEYVVVRDNTDPWKVALRPADAYRSLAVQHPDIRPRGWDGLDKRVQEAVNNWLDMARNQLQDNADTDGTLAQNRATASRYEASGIRRYRRVIHPELSKSGTCGLCVVAATNTFTRPDLMPMHNRCHCTVAPITESNDPGLKLNGDDLQKIYRAAAAASGKKGYSTSAADLTKLRVDVTSNSELGPILTRAQSETIADTESLGEWHMPDMQMTNAQMRRMYERASEFNRHYQILADSGKDIESFRYDGRNYTFKSGPHLKQAWDYVRSLLEYSRGWLGLAA
ncbi:hypothetical protein [Bifidobacterium oedipodis]|uniref:Phage protein n=1 Tax=Bifidobacterium oedipodis TaxID=2675322 RepID=A0A7Y0EP42_9BIFI|nr:hypothetical protein [Bifidobacterium sp. DSM 109957]NMM93878.1 phage protein [Bifidobacterium sp. DSM 109957]